MKASIITIDSSSPQQPKVREVSRILACGGIAAIPTETVFGLACDAANTEALKKLYAIKNRPEEKPFTIQVANIDKLLSYAGGINPHVEKILKEFWPGPLTVIVNTVKGKEGFRIPDNKVTLSILSETGFPLAVTSANFSGTDVLCTVEEVVKSFGHLIDVIIDDGSSAGGVESTVLDCTVTPFKILRKGAIADRLKRYV